MSERWGLVGTTTELGPLKTGEEGEQGYGFRREVEPDVTYQAPPLPKGSCHWARSKKQEFQLVLPRAVPVEQVLTFQALCDQTRQSIKDLSESEVGSGSTGRMFKASEIKSNGQTLTFDEFLKSREAAGTKLSADAKAKLRAEYNSKAERQKVAQKLDQTVEAFLDVVAHLHQGGCGIGLTSPIGIVVLLDKPQPYVILLDVGFDQEEDAIDKASWTKSEKNAYRCLWTSDPKSQLKRGMASRNLHDNFNPADDIPVIARILASGLLGYPTNAEDARADDTVQPCWSVLSKAIQGDYSTIQDFRDALSRAPISEHFNQRDVVVDSPHRLTWLIPALIAAGIALSIGGYVVAPPEWKAWSTVSKPLEVEPDKPGETPGRGKRPGENATAESLDAMVQRIKEMNGAPPDQLVETRSEFLEKWRRHFNEAYQQSKDPTAALDVGRALRDLHRQLTTVHRSEQLDDPLYQEEQQWLENCRVLALQVPYCSLDSN